MSARWRQSLVVGLVAGSFLVLLAAAVYTAIVDFTTDVDSSRHTLVSGWLPALTIWGAIFGGATYKTLSGRLFAGHRWHRIDDDLRASGFHNATSSLTADTAKIHVRLLAPGVLAMDRGGGIDHVMVGAIAGREVRCFRARLRGGRHWIDAPAVAFRLPASFAGTIIRPVKKRAAPPAGMDRVLFELERFNRSIEVYSADRYFASALVDQRMMEWLECHLGSVTIELADGWVIAWSTSLRGMPESPPKLLDFLLGFSEQMPGVVPSLFPKSARRTIWIQRSAHKGLSNFLERLSERPTDGTRRA